jgi:hypothetical protein
MDMCVVCGALRSLGDHRVWAVRWAVRMDVCVVCGALRSLSDHRNRQNGRAWESEFVSCTAKPACTYALFADSK